MYTKAMDERIKEFIKNEALIGTITILNGEHIKGKILYGLYLVVKTNINLYDIGFFNGDVCLVRGETLDNNLVIKRIKDQKEGIVDKNKISSADWITYKF